MTERAASHTALGVAALRVAHQIHDATPKILDDPVVVRLLEPEVIDHVRSNRDRYDVPGALALRAHVVLRSRYAEDRLALAVARGVKQYVVLGAGYDTFAFRQPSWASHIRVFEVDHPASQRAKVARLAAAGIGVPPNVEFVGIDFEHVSLRDGMAASGFDAGQAAFLSWLGVMMYLTQEAVDAVFQYVASLPKGSEIVFTFAQPSSAVSEDRLAARAAEVGEPWLTRVTPEGLASSLRGHGMSTVTFLTLAEAEARYFAGRGDLPLPRRVSIASGVV